MEDTQLSAASSNGVLLGKSGRSSFTQGKRTCQVTDKPKNT